MNESILGQSTLALTSVYEEKGERRGPNHHHTLSPWTEGPTAWPLLQSAQVDMGMWRPQEFWAGCCISAASHTEVTLSYELHNQAHKHRRRPKQKAVDLLQGTSAINTDDREQKQRSEGTAAAGGLHTPLAAKQRIARWSTRMDSVDPDRMGWSRRACRPAAPRKGTRIGRRLSGKCSLNRLKEVDLTPLISSVSSSAYTTSPHWKIHRFVKVSQCSDPLGPRIRSNPSDSPTPKVAGAEDQGQADS